MASQFGKQRDTIARQCQHTLLPPATHASSFSRLSIIGHSPIGAHPSQTRVSFHRVFFIDSRLLIFASMSTILASARVRIAALVVLRDTRRDSSSPISLSQNPTSSPPRLNPNPRPPPPRNTP